MKRVEKGTVGYLDYKKKVEILRTIFYFALVFAIYFLGYSQTHSNRNLLTIVAILGCLPAARALVGVITRFPYHSLDPEKGKEIGDKGGSLTLVYDLIITSSEKIMPISCAAISGHHVVGYTESKKVDETYTADFIKSMMKQNEIDNVSVKIWHEYPTFLNRVEEMSRDEGEPDDEAKEQEEKIRRLLENISL